MTSCPWVGVVLDARSTSEAWMAIFDRLRDLAVTSTSPIELHNQTVAPDRLLAESAWELWRCYKAQAPRTSAILRQWCAEPSSVGWAVLVLDAFSLRELPILLGGAQRFGVMPVNVKVTGSEAPSDTDQFARALGVVSRSGLANNGAPTAFALRNSSAYTDVLSLPFEDSSSSIPHECNLFLWHTWLDDLIHVHQKSPDQITKIAGDVLQSAGFWKFVDRLRQGRRVIITADHGYALSRLFAEERDPEVVNALRGVFGASRYKAASGAWDRPFMPPLVITENTFHVVMGQRKWKVQGGFPQLCHGGLSLLEVAVPWVELPPV